MDEAPLSRWWGWSSVALIAALHLFRNGIGMVDRAVWLDEASTYLVAAKPFVTNLTLPTEFHSQPPLYYLILHFLIPISSAEWFLRGFSWLCMLGVCLFILVGVHELNRVARVFFALAVVEGFPTRYLSQEMRPYALGAASAFVATLLFLRLLRDPTPRRARAYALAATVMLYSQAFDLWPFVAHGLFFALAMVDRAARTGGRAMWRELRWGVAAFGAASLAYLPYLYMAAAWQLGRGKPSLSGSLAAISAFSVYAKPLGEWLPLPLALSLLLVGVAAARDLRERRADLILWFLVVAGQIAFARGFLQGRSFFADRYNTPAFLSYIYVFARGAHLVTEAIHPLAQRALPLLLACVALDAAVPFARSLGAPVPLTRWREVERRLAAVPGRKVIFFDTGYEGQVLQYQARGRSDLLFALHAGGGWGSGGDNHLPPDYIRELIAREADRTRCFYYVVDKGAASPYFSAFVPAMQERGFAPSPLAPSLFGFCRP